MGNGIEVGKHILGLDRDNRATVVSDDFLHLPVHVTSAINIEFGAGVY